ncbi:hypothetical protein K7432_009684 [Basidiobolus ranarum]|uniref:DUF7707 domain-containing protein n=1 Tax=Basidiobolus ranarum TaxID=34480 RepID=A0ABR2WQ00_9FUNG
MKLLSFTVAAALFSSQVLAEWLITSLPVANRENICVQQKAYCSNNCGGELEAPKNFCNVTTMGWGCGCKTKIPDFKPYTWPIVLEECRGKAQDCQEKCNTSSDETRNQCYTDCSTKFQCGTDKAPPSYLEVPDVQATPLYTAAYPTNSPTPTPGETHGTSSNETSGASTNTVYMGSAAMALLAYAWQH